MFSCSKDEYIRSIQEEADAATLSLIEKYVRLKHAPELEEILEKNCHTMFYLEDFVTSFKNNGFQMVIPCIFRSEILTSIRYEINKGFEITSKNDYDYIPFVRFSFKEVQSYQGTHLQDIYMLFFTKYGKFGDNLDKILYHLNRFNKIRAFT